MTREIVLVDGHAMQRQAASLGIDADHENTKNCNTNGELQQPLNKVEEAADLRPVIMRN